jgi:predicted amidohydrolase
MARNVTLGMVNVLYRPDCNLAQRRAELLELVDGAGHDGCQIVALPEFADFHRTTDALSAYERGASAYIRVVGQNQDSPWLKDISKLACRHRMVVIPVVLLLSNGKAHNRALVYGPDGTVLGSHDETHLADGEASLFEPGQTIAPVATPFGRLGLVICYDFNFPEQTRCLELQGAELLLWMTMRQSEAEEGLFRARLPARALEHGMPLGVATYSAPGDTAERSTMSSVVYNALGQIVAGGTTDQCVVKAIVDLDNVPVTKRAWNNDEWVNAASLLRRSRRPDLYCPITRPLNADERDLSKEPSL